MYMRKFRRYLQKYRRYLVVTASVLTLASAAAAGVAVSATAQTVTTARATTVTVAPLITRPPVVDALRAQIATVSHQQHLAWGHHVHHVHHLTHLAELARMAAARAAGLAAEQAPVHLAAAPVSHSYAAPVSHSYAAPSAASPSESAPSAAPARYSGGSSFQQCVISRESGGNSQVVNGSGHYGLYQFSAGTWAEYGGSAASFGHASVAQQNQVFNNAMATAGGASNWSPYDGCTSAVITGAPRTNAVLDAVIRPALTAAQIAHIKHLAHLHYLHLLHLARLRAPRATLASASPGGRILGTAETRTGDWYAYGAAGPSTFDCSGLVYWAAHADGVNLPRTTYEMLTSSLLVRTSSPRPGDLAFFGPGHVEFVYSYGAHKTFGAAHSGTRVGVHTWNSYYAPTEFFRIR